MKDRNEGMNKQQQQKRCFLRETTVSGDNLVDIQTRKKKNLIVISGFHVICIQVPVDLIWKPVLSTVQVGQLLCLFEPRV